MAPCICAYGAGINWSPEEIAFINILVDKKQYYAKLTDHLNGAIVKNLGINLDEKFIDEFANLQNACLVSPPSHRLTRWCPWSMISRDCLQTGGTLGGGRGKARYGSVDQ